MAQNFNENKNISKQDAINLVISNVPESDYKNIFQINQKNENDI